MLESSERLLERDHKSSCSDGRKKNSPVEIFDLCKKSANCASNIESIILITNFEEWKWLWMQFVEKQKQKRSQNKLQISRIIGNIFVEVSSVQTWMLNIIDKKSIDYVRRHRRRHHYHQSNTISTIIIIVCRLTSIA